MSHRIHGAVLALCASVLALMGALALAPPAGAVNVGNTYLAVGDSLAYGFHEAQFNEELASGTVNPASFNDGYVNDFYELIKFFNPNLQLINDGCPGEGTETMIHGSVFPRAFCGGEDATVFPQSFLHHPYPAETQLQNALSILHSDPNVSPITLDIGANDLIRFLQNECGFAEGKNTCTEAQFAAEFKHVGENVAYILGQLRAAAPYAEIVMVGIYNSSPGYPAEGGDKLIAAFDKTLEAAASSVPGPRIGFANPLPDFNPSVIFGGPEVLDLRTICAYTAMCPEGKFNPHGDIHPTKLGYQEMAEEVNFQFLTH
jgi:lysophospholipase L1-like esterase